jgi:hypothetical protein
VEKYDRVGQATEDNTAHVLGMLGNGVNLWSHKKKRGPLIIAQQITTMTSHTGT